MMNFSIRRAVPVLAVCLVATFSVQAQANTQTCSQVTVSPAQIWPPNHAMIPVSLSSSQVTRLAPYCVMQDESIDANGDGSTATDAALAGGLKLRAERSGNGNGRVYRVYFAGQQNGGQCLGNVVVAVPKSANKAAVDGGPLYNSMGGADCRQLAPNSAPVLVTTTLTPARALSNWSQALTAVDAENDTFVMALTGGPAGLILSGNTLQWTPPLIAVGNHTITLTLTDARGATTTATLTLTVLPPLNQPPVALAANVSSAEDVALALTLQAADPDGDTLDYVITRPPLHGTLTGIAPNLVYTPDANFHGTDSFAFQAADLFSTSNEAVVTVQVTPVNDPPGFTSIPVTDLLEAQEWLHVLLAADADQDPLTFTLVAGPATLQLSGNLLSWTPDYAAAGSHPVTVQVADPSGGFARQDFVLQVSNANRPPLALGADITLGEDSSAPVYLAALDADGDAPDFVVTRPPLHGTLTGVAPDLVYTPDADFAGTDSFSFRATDLGGLSSEAVIRLEVNPVNDAPEFMPDPELALSENQPWSYTLGATDRDGDVVTFALVNAPAGMTLTATQLAWTPDYQQAGNVVVTVQAIDAAGAVVERSFTLAVADVNRAPQIVSQPQAFVTAGQLWSYQITASDADGDFIAYALRNAPAGVLFNPLTGTLQWSPVRADAGSWLIEVEAADSHGALAVQTFTLTVELPPNQAPRITVGELPERVTEGTLYSLLVSAEDPDGDPLSFALVAIDDIMVPGVPAGADIGLMSGLLTWIPTGLQVGEHRFLVRVTDSNGAYTDLPVAVTVRANLEPRWLSQPVTSWTEPDSYRYDLSAIDPEGQAISYRLDNGPAGMVIDGAAIVWAHGFTGNGTHLVTVVARDAYGKEAAQGYTLLMNVQRPPEFTSTPPEVILESESVDYLATAIDPNGLPVSISAAGLPAGADFAADRLRWNPTAAHVLPLTSRTLQCRKPSTSLDFAAIKPAVRFRTSIGQTYNTPIVGQLSDDNGDGLIDDKDTPEIVFTTAYAAPGMQNASNGRIHVLDGITGEQRWAFVHPTDRFQANPHVAIADLNNDGAPELVVPVHSPEGLVATTADGRVLWTSDNSTLGTTAFAGASSDLMVHVQDLDGDGWKEIVAGRVVLNHDGSLRKTLAVTGNPGKIEDGYYSYSTDLDGDGSKEIIVGPQVFDHNGNVLWKKATPAAAYSAAADIDSDGSKEIFFVHGGGYLLTDRLGNARWSRNRALINVGIPSAGDINGDGTVEFVYASWESLDGYVLHAVDSSGEIMWSVNYSDDSVSGHSGVALFDFNGDGALEVVHSDEGTIRIIDGASGRVVWTMAHGNRTRHEYAAIADLDGDGSAEMIAGGDRIQVFGAAANNWMPAPRSWPQYTTTDWSDFVPNMVTPTNAFRTAGFSDSTTYLPNIGVQAARLVTPMALRVAVVNRGDIDVNGQYRVRISDGNGVLGVLDWPLQLVAGATANTTISLGREPAGDVDVSVEPLHGYPDCLDTDNSARLAQFLLRAEDANGDQAQQRFFVNVLSEQSPPQLPAAINGGEAAVGALYRFRVQATDPDRGELLRYSLPAPLAGMRINHTNGELSWTPPRSVAGQTLAVRVQVTDTAGNSAETTLSMTVPDSPEAPVFVSLPRATFIPDADYIRQIEAVDYNIGDRVSYTLERGPKGMTLDSTDGTIVWPLADLLAYRQPRETTDTRCTGFDVVPTSIWFYETATTTNEGWFLEYGFRNRANVSNTYQYGSQLTWRTDTGATGNSGLTVNGTENPFTTGRFVDIAWELLTDDIIYRAYRSNGSECQTANNTIKVPLVVVRATDLTGRSTRTAFTINVEDTVNNPPKITSDAGTDAAVGTLWQYSLIAADADPGETFYYSVQSPTLTLARTGNVYSLTPTLAQVGLHPVTFTVTDSGGLTASETVQVRIHDPAVTGSRPPVVTSAPVLTAVRGQPYTYTLTASDPDGDAIQVSWDTDGPYDTFEVTPGTGGRTFTWTPQTVKGYPFRATVRDSNGLETRQSFVIEVTAPVTGAPVISSTPAKYVTAGSTWSYTPVATDPEGAAVTFLKYSGPSQLQRSGNTFSWATTAADVGLHSIELRAADPGGTHAAQRFVVQVNPVQNRAPVITSTPVTTRTYFTTPNADYTYAPTALDADGDPLTWRLVSGPPGMYWWNSARRVQWDREDQVMNTVSPVTIAVTDGRGGETLQTWQLTVAESQNQAPAISDQGTITIPAAALYTRNVSVNDPNGDPFQLSLLFAPAGMQLVGSQIRWTPQPSQVGTHEYMLKAVDDQGAFHISRTLITVSPGTTNYPPYFTVLPTVFTVEAGRTYSYTTAAKDPNSNPLTYSLASGPAGAQFNAATRTLTWTPTRADIGGHQFVLRVSDGTYSVDQIVGLTVTAPQPVGLELGVLPDVVNANEPVTLWIDGFGGYGALTAQLWVNNVPQTLADNAVIFRPPTPGVYEVRARVTDAEGTWSERTHTVLARADGDTTAPVITLHNVNDNDSLTAPLALQASIDDANLRSYLVRFRPLGGTWQDLAVGHVNGAGPISNAVLATIDPSLLLNGFHELKVAALDLNDNYSEVNLSLLVEGDLKVGNFSFTVEDVNVPLSGLPVRVARSYDTRQRLKTGDFGYGWALDVSNARLEENRDPGAQWVSSNNGALFPTWCVNPVGKRRISVTLPDGQVERFTMTMKPACKVLVHPTEMEPLFTPEEGTTSTLATVASYTHLTLVGGRLIDGLTGENFNPDLYKLTTRTGYVYVIQQASGSQKGGIRTVTDPNGNVITYSAGGISHSDGSGVSFTRDAQQRITAITDPNGGVQLYGYDAAGDLVSHADALANVTTYAYASGVHAHALTEIRDPLNRPLVKNLYDADGRLYAQEDNAGNRTLFEHVLAGRYSIVTDRNGNREILEYNDRGDVIRRTDGENQVWQFTYDPFGNLLTETDPLNRTTTRVVNAKGDVLSITDALGHTVAYTYNARGQELTITDALGRVHTNTYDFVGNLLKVEDPAGNEASTILGAKGLPQSAKDLLGNTTRYGYDGNGRKTSETDPLGHVTTWTHDANGNVLTETRQRTVGGVLVNETTTRVYDAKNRVIRTTAPDGSVTGTEYDAAGNEAARIDARGNRIEMGYDAYGRLIETRYPDGSTEAQSYDDEGNRVAETDRNGNTTTYAYDGNDRLVRTTYEDGTFTETAYDQAGQVIAETDARGNTTTHAYDQAGRRISTTDALGAVVAFDYDANGNLIGQIDANGHAKHYEYNLLDQRVKTIFPDGSTVQETFDAEDRRLTSRDQVGLITTYGYDAPGRLLTVLDAAGFTTSFTYDEHGNKLTQTDTEGRTTQFRYDALGREIATVLPLGQASAMTYDANGNTATETDFNGDTTTYTHDDNDRVIHIAYADGQSEAFTWDDNGNRLTATNAQGTTAYQYDVLNRLTREEKPDGSVLTYAYDANGNRTRVTVSGHGRTATTRYTYDALNRLHTVTDEQGGVTTHAYDAAGNLVTLTFPNGFVTTYSHDDLNRPLSVITRNAQSQIVGSETYTLHPTGRRTRLESFDGTTTTTRQYRYDLLYRLFEETTLDQANVVIQSGSYTYDKVGNRVYGIEDGVHTAYAYDANDRLLSAGGVTYAYDAAGNVLSETEDGQTRTYDWDAKHRLQQASTPQGLIDYLYDVDGIRTAKTVNGNRTDYVVDHNTAYAQVLLEADATGTATAYTRGLALLEQNRNGTSSYFHADALGSTKQLSDSSGTVTDRYAYTAFGKPQSATGATPNSYRYTGEQFDDSLGQYYLRARNYDPRTGRFTGRDPFAGIDSNPVTLHDYIYAGNDPALNTDPGGQMFGINGAMAGATIRGGLYGLQIYGVANTGLSFLRSLAAGDTREATEQAGLGLLAMLGPVAFSRYAVTYGKKLRDSKTFSPLIACTLGNSFTGDTLVQTARGLIPIRDVKIGDQVLSFDERTGEFVEQPVVHLIQREKTEEYVILGLDNGEIIEATREHPFYVGGVWVEAGRLRVADVLTAANGNAVRVASIRKETRTAKAYNLEVANSHTYLVSSNNVVVHNSEVECPIKNVQQYLATNPIGILLKKVAKPTGVYKGQTVFKVTAPIKISLIREGEYFHADVSHERRNGKLHIEVYDKRGRPKYAISLEGKVMPYKGDRKSLPRSEM